jgi:20S proteasome subunit alpha 6
LGLKSDNYVVLASLKKSPHDLATHQEKIFEIDDHMGIAIAGLTADARFLCKYMRNECLNYWYQHDSHHPTERLVTKIAQKSQHKTNHPAKRPFGVGLLVAGVDETGTHLFETCPSGNHYEYFSMAIGARCQSSKTYLEKNFDGFRGLDWKELVKHALKALKASAQETELTEHNVSVGFLGKADDEKFRLLQVDELREYLAQVNDQMEMA